MKKATLIAVVACLCFACYDPASKPSVTPKAERVSAPKPIWQASTQKDEFGDEIEGEKNILAQFSGVMSNSATTKADVLVQVQIGQDKSTYISFLEYGKVPGNLPEKKSFNVKIKKADDSTEFVRMFSMRNVLAETEGVLLDRVLSQSEPLKVNVDLSRAEQHSNTVYNFEIKPKGLRALLE